MQNPELARKRRLMASDIGTRKNTVKLISRRLVVIGFEHIRGKRLSEAARADDERIIGTASFQNFNELGFVDVGQSLFADIRKVRIAIRREL